MTMPETPVATGNVDTQTDQPSTAPVPTESSEPTPCAGYKEAKYLAASRRLNGADAYAVYVVALESWCVR